MKYPIIAVILCLAALGCAGKGERKVRLEPDNTVYRAELPEPPVEVPATNRPEAVEQPTTRVVVAEVHQPHHHPHPGLPHYGPPYQQDTFIGYQGKTTSGDNLAVGVMVRDTYDPRMIKAHRDHDKRREAAAKPEVERLQREKAAKEQKKKDDEEQKKRDAIKAKKSK